MTICTEKAIVYRGGNRRFFTKKAAIKAEAIAIIKNKYPNEKPEYEQGRCIYGGFHCTSLPRFDVLLRRVMRLVSKELK